jgi:hypothetical protein
MSPQGVAGTATVTKIRSRHAVVPVYNLTVEGTSRYLVGACGVVVHNTNGCGADGAEGAGVRILQRDLDHIVARHWPRSASTGAGKFAADIRLRSLVEMVRAAVAHGTSRPNTRGRPGTVIEYSFERVIGIDIVGNPTSRLRVVVRPDGSVQTAFPY